MIRLDLADIQGNIHRAYGRYGFPFCRHMFFNIRDPAGGRRFVDAIRPRVTTAEPWETKADDGRGGKPAVALNIGFTWQGLRALDLPTRTLRLLPDEFIDGMPCRAEILGDVGDSGPPNWDPIWRYEPYDFPRQVHVWVSLNVGAAPNGEPFPVLEEWTLWLQGLAADGSGIVLLDGHGPDGAGTWQDSQALTTTLEDGTKQPVAKEYFGFTDGISDPVFDGQFTAAEDALDAVGGGKIIKGAYDPAKSWLPLEAGEFILGQTDEGQEFPVATQPASFARNGTFMVWRKLRQDVAGFDAAIKKQADVWKRVTGVTDDAEAVETVRAKIVGRWSSGIPLAVAPTYADDKRLQTEWGDCFDPATRKRDPGRLADFQRLLTGFRYADDIGGTKCPLGAHIRRANPRDMLDQALGAAEVGKKPPDTATTLTNRRRILRRGLPYASGEEKGVIFMGMCSSLFRQFEFIQQQWMNYGLDFEAGNDSCPLIGNRQQPTKHVVAAGAANATPFIAADLPQFVATRGGDYFFVPSLSALRMIAMGTVDPT